MKLNLNLKEYPYSVFGSWLTLKQLENGSLMLRSAQGYNCQVAAVKLRKAGRDIPFEVESFPEKLVLTAKEGSAELLLDGADILRFRTKGTAIRFESVKDVTGIANECKINSSVISTIYSGGGLNTLFHFQAVKGDISFTSDWNGVYANNFQIDFSENGEGLVLQSNKDWISPEGLLPFDQAVQKKAGEFQSFSCYWLEKAKEPDRELLERVCYYFWSLAVFPAGVIRRTSMLVSKGGMAGLWPWDHCFPAIALAKSQPQLALDQFLVVLDLMNEQGRVPDKVLPEFVNHLFVKPPIHGLTYLMMREENPEFFSSKEVLDQVYEPLCRWADYWIEYRATSHSELPLYHHSCDSGWDNATCFLPTPPWTGPDLLAYLVILLDLLASMAEKRGEIDRAEEYQSTSELICLDALEYSWKDGRFHMLDPEGDHIVVTGDSLLLFLPLVLGKKLDGTIRKKLLEGLFEEGRFLTEFGLATESLKSPLHQKNGYWRGPIWPCVTLIFWYALKRCGCTKEADMISERFLKLCREHGFSENFDPVTGEGLREPVFHWSAAVFLFFATR